MSSVTATQQNIVVSQASRANEAKIPSVVPKVVSVSLANLRTPSLHPDLEGVPKEAFENTRKLNTQNAAKLPSSPQTPFLTSSPP